jgi:hypothetical protein
LGCFGHYTDWDTIQSQFLAIRFGSQRFKSKSSLVAQLMLQSKIALAVFTYSLFSDLPFFSIPCIFSNLFYSKVRRAFGQAAVLMHTRPCVDLHQNILVFL